PWSGVRMISLITLFAFSSCLSSSTPSSRLQGARHNASTIISLFIQPPSRSDSFSPEWCRRQERSTAPNWTPNARDESIPTEILASCAGPLRQKAPSLGPEKSTASLDQEWRLLQLGCSPTCLMRRSGLLNRLNLSRLEGRHGRAEKNLTAP